MSGVLISVRFQISHLLNIECNFHIVFHSVVFVVIGKNSKGVIPRAFEQFRLKSCVDFKPGQQKSFTSLCWSYIGRSSPGGQTLSIGERCGRKGIVEHQFLHALGLNHDNFNKHSENVFTTQESPYDYYSVMHLDKNAFKNFNGPTIITKSPELQDVIGQLMEMSEYDAIELNKLYKCNSSVSFLDHCSFDEESLCEMSVSSRLHLNELTSIHSCSHSRLESKTLTPTRDCKVQCLQFYYYHSGHESDPLNIWIRELQNQADSTGALRLMDQITETPGNYWKLHHVQLNANKSFQVVFEARKGAGNSNGGFSLDDINISETECPLIWQIRDIEKELNSGFRELYSPLYYSSDGYRFGARLLESRNQLTISLSLVSGACDEQLQWPCPWRQITVQILDQNPHIQKRMSFEQSVTTDPDLTRYEQLLLSRRAFLQNQLNLFFLNSEQSVDTRHEFFLIQWKQNYRLLYINIA
uniref:Metalloendopeptidase n=1 Tax=Sinocyclocheilus anshuiensis TaxID=1608454 RepID=A0A671R6B8_9TELE